MDISPKNSLPKFSFLLFLISLFYAHGVFEVQGEMISRDAALISEEESKGLFDLRQDYAKFYGRVTDKFVAEKVMRIKTENNNIKFLRVGDLVQFKVAQQGQEDCQGFVRGVERDYLTLYVRDLLVCWPDDKFRRGTLLNLESKALETRVFQAGKFRANLLMQKKDFLKQLNGINHFLGGLDQIKIKKAAQYDKEIQKIYRRRQMALNKLGDKRDESILLQKELIKKMDDIEEDLSFYRIEGYEQLVDRWNMDHDLGAPVDKRPQKILSQE